MAYRSRSGRPAVCSERISRWRRARSDEPDPDKGLQGVVSRKRIGKVGDELIHGDSPTDGLGLKPGERFRWKVERYIQRSNVGVEAVHADYRQVLWYGLFSSKLGRAGGWRSTRPAPFVAMRHRCPSCSQLSRSSTSRVSKSCERPTLANLSSTDLAEPWVWLTRSASRQLHRHVRAGRIRRRSGRGQVMPNPEL